MNRFVVFGVLLGAALGIISSSLDIVIWISMERPAVLVRQGWEEVHVAFVVIPGLFAGWLYGMILSQTVNPEDLQANRSFVLLVTLLVGIALYTTADFISVKLLNLWPWLSAHVSVFLISLVIARLRSGPLRAR